MGSLRTAASRATLTALAACLAAVPVPASADRFEPVRRLIRERIAAGESPSVAVSVARGGRLEWEEGFGWADREAGLAASPYLPYSVASVTKPITAAALMLLVERGAVDLDRPVNDYLGEAALSARAGEADQATVRRVASHTAGLPLHYHLYSDEEPERPPPLAETIRRHGRLLTPPGERFVYSNLGYAVLERVIERASGRSYEAFVREELFAPLGMRASTIGPPAARHAARYGEEGERLPGYDFDHRAASAVFASAHDLVRFALPQLDQRLPDQRPVPSRRSVRHMQRPVADTPGGGSYGLGWETGQSVRGHAVVRHTGGMAGVSAVLAMVPSAGVAVAVVANARCELPHVVAERVLSRLLSLRPGAVGALPRFWAPPASPRPARFRPSRHLAGAWTGEVETERGRLPVSLRFERSGRVEARLDGREGLLFGAEQRGGLFTGRLIGRLEADPARPPRLLLFSLTRRGRRLDGSLTVLSRASELGSAVSHWVELRKDAAVGPGAARR